MTNPPEAAPLSAQEWRVGKSVPVNVYEGDRPICQCHTVLDARRIVESVNAAERLRASPSVSAQEDDKSIVECFFDAHAPFHWNKADVLRIMEAYAAGRLRKLESMLDRFTGDIPKLF